MAINYAIKYEPKVDERFNLSSVTTQAVNTDYDFVGVDSINVYSIPTVGMNDYTKSGGSRYGTPSELGDNIQTLKLTQDRSFTFTIDKGNRDDTMMTKEAGKALARQLDEVVIPEVDIYRLAKIVAGAGTTSTPTAVTKNNAYEMFLDGVTALTDKKVPTAGRISYVSPKFYKNIKLDDSFIKAGDLSQEMLRKGQIGEVDGIPLILVPTSYLPTNVEFAITHPIATVAANKLEDYTTHKNPPGISGDLVEGRIRYDAFVLDEKKNAIYVHMGA